MRHLALLTFALTACGTPYPCCVDGVTSECTCPAGDLCMRENFRESEDGTCSSGIEGDSGDTGDTGG